MITDPLTWVPLNVIAIEYHRSPESMRLWCVSGFMLELGYSLRKDELGRWQVGVPASLLAHFSEVSYRQLYPTSPNT